MILLLFATGREMQATLAGLDAVSEVPYRAGGRDFLPVVTGIGPINAAMKTAEILAEQHGRIEGAVLFGIAGAFRSSGSEIGGQVLVREEIWPEFGLRTASTVDPEGLGLPLGEAEGKKVFGRLPVDSRRVLRGLGLHAPAWPDVVSLTVAGVSGDRGRADELETTFGAAVENMEGFACAWACLSRGVPFAEVRTVSNVVGEREGWNFALALSRLGSAMRALLGLPEEA